MTAGANSSIIRATNRSQLLKTVAQIAKFMTVGVLNTLIDAGTYFILTRGLGLMAMPVLAKSIAYVVGMINSFFWNRNWTFKSQTSTRRAAFLFTLTHIVALGINAGVMALCINVLALPEIIGIALATISAFIWNFALNKLLVFQA
jgi:putative flippase GtrA